MPTPIPRTPAAHSNEASARRFRNAALPLLGDAHTFARYLLRDAVAAEETVEECYRLAQRLFDPRRDVSVRSWLLTMLRHLCHARLAGLRSATAMLDGAGAASGWTPRAPAVSDLRQRVMALPTQLREALVLRDAIGLGYDEIGDVIGATRDDVQVRLLRARALLAERTSRPTRTSGRSRPCDLACEAAG